MRYPKTIDARGCHITKTIISRYLVIDINTSYNVLLGHQLLNLLGVVVSTLDLTIKFSSLSEDIITIHDDQKMVREFYIASL